MSAIVSSVALVKGEPVKVMVSAPGSSSALIKACRREPAPLSSVLVTSVLRASMVCTPAAVGVPDLLPAEKVTSARVGAVMLMVLPAVAPISISATRNNVPVSPLLMVCESPVKARELPDATTPCVPREVSPASKIVSVE